MERFSDRVRTVLAMANREFHRFHHDHIGTEHILLCIVREGTGVAANVLKNLQIDLKQIAVELDQLLSQNSPLPSAKKLIGHAIEEARSLGHSYVGTEHLLLGLLKMPGDPSAKVLSNRGLTHEAVRQGVIQFLGGSDQH